MLIVKLVAGVLFGLVHAPRVRNPIPVSAAGAPPLAAEDSAGGALVRGRCSVVIGVDRLVWWPWLVLWSVVSGLRMRSARRRLRRRAGWRLLLAFPVVVWLYPFGAAWVAGELDAFVRGRVQVRGDAGPVRSLAVVLVPAPRASDADAAAAGAYSRLDPGPGLAAESADIWLWPDVDGWFSTMHVVAGLPYRVEVRRPACRTESFGVRVFQYAAPWGRRLRLEADQCVAG